MTDERKLYTGSVYIGVVGSELENGECRDSIDNLIGRPGDVGPQFIRATKGFEARQMHFNNWYFGTDCAFLFLMDSDMVFPRDALEILRGRQFPYICGTYMRRMYSPMAPVHLEVNEDGMFPFKPSAKVLERNVLYEMGASGWGCMLVHRDVVTAMLPLLKGEALVIEDDMDVWPYDLPRIMAALDVLDNMTKKDVPAASLRDYVDILRQEIRPLRGAKDNVGSDIRFPFFARQAGFPLYVDGTVQCKHMLNYPVSPDDFAAMGADAIANVDHEANKGVRQERDKLRFAKDMLSVAHVDGAK